MKANSIVTLLALASVATGCEQSSGLAQQAADIAALNPPPRASERAQGVSVESCDLGTPIGANSIEGEGYYCGVFTVPQDWDEPDGARIDLRFSVVKATGDSPQPDPLVFLAGGPGQSAIATALTAYEAILPTRDVLRMDQRGTGTSQRLGLEECLILALQDERAEEDVEVVLQSMAAANQEGGGATNSGSPVSGNSVKETVDRLCWGQFTAQGLDLDTFNSSQSARDVVELLKALDYTVFNLHGISYGTRLAMTIMRELDRIEAAPELRAVVLDSPYPPSMHLLESTPHNYHDPVIRLFDECRLDPVCADAYPNLKSRFKALLADLESEPIVAEAETIGAQGLVRTIVDLRGTRAGYMPRMIAELETGNAATFHALGRNELGAQPVEAAGGLDADDPMQAYIASVMSLLGSGGEITAGMQFVTGFSKAVREDQPIQALERFISDEYPDEVRDRLLGLTEGLSLDDIEASQMVAELRARAASPPSAQEQAAAKARADRLLAIVEIAQFLNTNIHCAEDLPFSRLDDALAVLEKLEVPQLAHRDNLIEQAARCDSWPGQPQPRTVTAAVESDVPTLILQGAYDVKTPVIMGQEADRQLSRSTLAIVPQQGHEVWTRSTNCPARIAAAFVLDPSRPPDLVCLEARKPQWALPDGG